MCIHEKGCSSVTDKCKPIEIVGQPPCLKRESKGLQTEQAEASSLSVLLCATCDHWKTGITKHGCDDDLPYCNQLRFWIAVRREYIHTSADFGCVKHSALST